MSNLKNLKKIYDRLGNDSVRSKVLSSAELLGVRKDILRMDTNNYCNISCIMCNRSHTSLEKHYMSLENFTSLIDRFASTTRNLYLSCACEPLATPHFEEYLKYAKSKGIPFVSFCTNALALHQNIIEKTVDMGIDEIIISFNGFTREDYNRIMQGSDYDKVCHNLKALNEYKQKCGSVKPQIRLNTVLLKSNLYHLENLKEFIFDYGIDIIQFRELLTFENQNHPDEIKKESLSALSLQDYQELMQKTKEMANYLRSQGKEVILPLWIQNYTPVTVTQTGESAPGPVPEKQHNPDKHTCSIPFFSYWIDWEGYVRVCGYDEKGIIGNVFRDDFSLLKNQRKQFRKLALCGECSSELCTMNINTSALK